MRGYGYTVDTQHWLARSSVHLAHDPTPQTALSIPERVWGAATLLPEAARNRRYRVCKLLSKVETFVFALLPSLHLPTGLEASRTRYSP